jgi:hypothetical protein
MASGAIQQDQFALRIDGQPGVTIGVPNEADRQNYGNGSSNIGTDFVAIGLSRGVQGDRSRACK